MIASRTSSWLGLLLLSIIVPGATRSIAGRTEAPPASEAAGPRAQPGLCLTFAEAEGYGAATDKVAVSNVWLYVSVGQSPTSFLRAGVFTATWTGFVTLETRGDYQFQAELDGRLRLELNGVTVLSVAGSGGTSPPSAVWRLQRGANRLVATFQSPASGDAFLRLFWFNRETPRQPIPEAALTFASTAAFRRRQELRLGRGLFLQYRCLKCHVDPSLARGLPELAMDAPRLDGIGSRRNFAWLARWIANPQAERPTAVMPRMLDGPEARGEARAMAAFLHSLKGRQARATEAPSTARDQILAGKRLFDDLHCIACHNAMDRPDTDATRISLKDVRDKFAPGALAAFLLKPDANFAWTRMPRFELTESEAAELGAFLEARARVPDARPAPADPALLERGKALVETRGCLNCHDLKLENRYQAPALAALRPARWDAGCLADAPSGESKAPRFDFTSEQRAALRAFGATDRTSLGRDVPAEFAARQTRRLRCRECHGKFDGFPALDGLGEKLRPEWTARFLAGEIIYKPRPWLAARMPVFPRWADELAGGLAEQAGYPPRTPTGPPIDLAAAEVGRKLVSAAGGLSCVSCHAVGNAPSMQVAEGAGVNLAYVSARLRRSYFDRWVRNPQSINPTTKMPVFFDENDQSPLVTVYGGDGVRQRNALWQYLRLGDRMRPPPAP